MSTAVHPLDPYELTSDAWAERIGADGRNVETLVPDGLRALHTVVVERARATGCRGLILSGSTARGSRTETSDLDYHLIGCAIATQDLSAELDLHVLTPGELRQGILDGDDFIHWSVRFGRILLDDGPLLAAARLIVEERPWPDVERKREHAMKSLRFASRVVQTGDDEGGLIQTRTALSLAARAHLLSVGEFPMSRAELPGQLAIRGASRAAAALEACIHGEPDLGALAEALGVGFELVGERAPSPAA